MILWRLKNLHSFMDNPIGKWNVSDVTDFSIIFYAQSQFKKYIGSWDMYNATVLNGMFHGAASFNHDISFVGHLQCEGHEYNV